MTEKQRGLYKKYLESPYNFLDDVYKNPSWNKKRAFWCIFDHDIEVYHAFDFRVCAANAFQFSMGCRYLTDDNKLFFRYHTRENVYEFEIDNDEI